MGENNRKVVFVIGSWSCVVALFYPFFCFVLFNYYFLGFTQRFDSDFVNAQPIQKGKITGVSFIAVMEVLRN